MREGNTLAKKLLSILAIVLAVAAAVVLSPGFRRWRRGVEIRKQLEGSGDGAKNVIIKDGFIPKGEGTIRR
jgi:hypothetical protein